MLEARKNRGCHVMYTSGKCFYDIEEDVEMHIMKMKRTRKMGTPRQKAMTNPYIFYYEL